MFPRVMAILALVAGSGWVAQAQGEPPVDSLVADFIQRGALSWGPHRLFEGCPALKSWQERGFRILGSADLPLERTNELGGYWSSALRDCNDPRLEQWYFEHFTAALRRGEASRMLGFWFALEHADSPRIREYLRGVMLDLSLSVADRSAAGTILLERFDREERLQEYLRAFETMRMPDDWGQTYVVLTQAPDRLLREVGRLVSLNPALAEQAAFTEIAESSARFASVEARRALGEALQAGLDRGGGVSERSRTRLEGTAQWLKRPSQ